jgi:hypothetical protein
MPCLRAWAGEAMPSLIDLERNDIKGALALYQRALDERWPIVELEALEHSLYMLQDDAKALQREFVKLRPVSH